VVLKIALQGPLFVHVFSLVIRRRGIYSAFDVNWLLIITCVGSFFSVFVTGVYCITVHTDDIYLSRSIFVVIILAGKKVLTILSLSSHLRAVCFETTLTSYINASTNTFLLLNNLSILSDWCNFI